MLIQNFLKSSVGIRNIIFWHEIATKMLITNKMLLAIKHYSLYKNIINAKVLLNRWKLVIFYDTT